MHMCTCTCNIDLLDGDVDGEMSSGLVGVTGVAPLTELLVV